MYTSIHLSNERKIMRYRNGEEGAGWVLGRFRHLSLYAFNTIINISIYLINKGWIRRYKNREGKDEVEVSFKTELLP